MTAVLLAALLVGSHPAIHERAPLVSERPRAAVRVTASDPDGGADAGLASALAQALVDAGVPAAPEHRSPGECRDECVAVSVRKTESGGFLIEVRARGDLALELMRLDPGASAFDRVHALAIEVELLAARAHPARVRHARSVAVATPQAPERALIADPAALAPLPAPSPEPVAPLVDDGPAPPPLERPVPAVQQQPPQKVPAADERLALNVGPTMLAGVSDDLLMHGLALGIRLRLTRRLDARASISFLRPQNIDEQGVRYHLELLPLAVATTIEVPGLPRLRAGAGAEGLLVTPEQNGGGPSYWAIGPIARLEYRYALRSFALLPSVQAAFHPASWSTAGDSGPLVAIPLWTVGLSVALEFRIF